MNKAIFLDRDGTINVDVDYLHQPEKIQYIEGVIKALLLLQSKGYKLIVVSNQSGVGRGYFPIEDVRLVNDTMKKQLRDYGIQIESFYFCPHVKEDECLCRKPSTYMYEQAARDYDIDIAKSYMVGDKVSDILPGITLGAGYGLLLSGHEIEQRDLEQYQKYCYRDLLEFAESI